MEELKKSGRIIDGKYVIVQRGDYQRIIQFNSQQTIIFGKGQSQQDIQLKNALGQEYYSAFRVLPLLGVVEEDTTTELKLADEKNYRKPKQKVAKKLFYLEQISEPEAKSFNQLLEISSSLPSGKDNRNIWDNKDNSSQSLGQFEIHNLKDQGLSPQEIVSSIISGSNSFANKTEYSQEKYLKKKEKVHGDVILFLKPDLYLIAEYYFKKNPLKILGLRVDSISQILSYANVHAYGRYIVYENANGLLIAALLQRMGGLGLLLQCQSGTNPQKQSLFYMNFTEEELIPLRNLDVFYLIKGRSDLNTNGKGASTEIENVAEKVEEPPEKRIKTEDNDTEMTEVDHTESSNPIESDGKASDSLVPKLKITSNRVENEKSLELLTTEFDGLIICGKEHPLTILQKLLPYLGLSCPFIVYSSCPEPLIECYMWIKERGIGINMHIVDNWLRNIQVETARTHPEINMSSSGGYILYGIYVKDV